MIHSPSLQPRLPHSQAVSSNRLTYQSALPHYAETNRNSEPDTRSDTAKADSELAIAVHNVLLDRNSDKPVDIPKNSSLGKWFVQFKLAIFSQAYTDYASEKRISEDTLYFHTASNSVTGDVDGVRNEIKLAGSEEQPAILSMAMAAATIIDSGQNRGLSSKDALKSSLPLATVLAFYGVDRNDPDVITALGRDKAFAPISSPPLIKSDKARGPRTLLTHQRLVGDSYDRNAINLGLKRVLACLGSGQFKGHSVKQLLEGISIYISPGSSYSQAHHCPDETTVSLAHLIQASGRPLPVTRADVLSLQTELSANADIFLEDALLAERYSRALQQDPKPTVPLRLEVPAHSVMGAWLALYRSHLEQPVVVQWLRDQGIDPATVRITPATGSLSASVNGSPKSFSLTDDSGWRVIASPLVAAAKVIAPGPQQQLARPVGNPAFTATADEIGVFYGEQPNPGAARLATLKAQGGFDYPAPDEALQSTSRSMKSLAHHEQLAASYYAPLAKAAADKVRAQREAERYNDLLNTTGQALPVVRNEAKKWADKIIREKYPDWHGDSDKVFLNRFDGTASSAQTATGWEHMEEPSSSMRLPDALLHNFNEKDQQPGDLDLKTGLYTVGSGHGKEGYGLHNQFTMAPSEVMKDSWKTDFQEQFSQQLATFWNDHRDDYRTLLKGEFVRQARQQLKAFDSASSAEKQNIPAEQRLTRENYQRVMAAVAGNVPLDANQPLTLDQLRAEAPVETRHGVVHALVINGMFSSDILRISKSHDSEQILYIPGHEPAFLCFQSPQAMDQWIADQGNDPQKRKNLASHFRLKDRQDNDSFGSDFGTFITGNHQPSKGVDTALKNVGSGYWSNSEGVVIDNLRVNIHGDVFSALTEVAEQRMESDADVTIKSSSEISRDTWLNDMTAAAGLLSKFAVVGEPLVVAAAAATGLAEATLGTEKAVSGDTQGERKQGASAALDGALNTLFSATNAGAEEVEDPFLLPIESAPVTVIAPPRPKPTVALRRETFADGTQALTTEAPLSEHAYTLPRANGFDVIDEDRVYRYDPKRPDVMSDLHAADDYKELDEFEAYCPAHSGRAKRGVSDTCFVRTVNKVEDEQQKELQALEHVRLYPSPKKLLKRDRFSVFEKRLYKVDGEKLVSVPREEPVTYKSAIRGSLVNDKNFGFYDGTSNAFVETETRVVKLGPISDLCDDSREVRGVVIASPRKGDATKYLVVEADVGEFYYVKLDNLKKPDALFTKCAPSEFDKALAKSYRNTLYANQTAGGTSLDNPFIALPKLDSVYKDLENAGYAKADVNALKTRCANMTAEQKREVAYQLQRRGATGNADAALNPADVRPLLKSESFDTLTPAQQNAFYAQQALQTVKKDMQATGLGPGNVVRSAADRARAQAASSVVNWLRETRDPRSLIAGKNIIKAGAGNCGEMAALSREIINRSGGRAYEWFASDSHAFTVVGGPSIKPEGSVNFAEPQWADAWIVDPWADIACPASEYTQKLEQTLQKWTKDGWKIMAGANDAMSPTDTQWLDTLIREPKKPYAHGYAAEPKSKTVKAPLIPVPSPLPTAETVTVWMGFSETVKDSTTKLSTSGLTHCSAVAVLTDLKEGVYQTRTLMHLNGSVLEGGLNTNIQGVLNTLDKSLANGGKVVFVAGVDSQSTMGMGRILGQEIDGRKPLLEMLNKPGVETVLASCSGVDINPDGTLKLVDGVGKGLLDPSATKAVLDAAAD